MVAYGFSTIVSRGGLLLCFSLLALELCDATNLGIARPSSFSINTLLTCFINEDVPEERLRLLLAPGRPGTVWLPVDTAYRLPPGSPNSGLLLQFLGPDFSNQFTSLTLPAITAPLARDFLPVIGSGGEEMLFQPDVIEPELDDFAANPVASQFILSWIGQQGLANCPIDADWTLLPNTFFPPYIAASFCEDRSCSFPPGLSCYPDIGEDRITYVTMLRWDCCWSFFDRKWNWRCGWRKVDVPLIVSCACSCQPQP